MVELPMSLIVQTFIKESTVSNGKVEEGVAISNNTLLFFECIKCVIILKYVVLAGS